MAWKGDDDTTVGQRVGSRGTGLASRTIAGQTAYAGGVGDEMLAQTGARAAVFENDIIVHSQFNAGNLDDQSLFMHELSHRDLGWGEEGSQAMEMATMVLQKMEGFDFSLERGVGMVQNMKGAAGDQFSGEAIVKMVAGDKRTAEDVADPMTAYFGQLAQGLSHEEVVNQIGKWAHNQMQTQEEDRQFRSGEGGDM